MSGFFLHGKHCVLFVFVHLGLGGRVSDRFRPRIAGLEFGVLGLYGSVEFTW